MWVGQQFRNSVYWRVRDLIFLQNPKRLTLCLRLDPGLNELIDSFRIGQSLLRLVEIRVLLQVRSTNRTKHAQCDARRATRNGNPLSIAGPIGIPRNAHVPPIALSARLHPELIEVQHGVLHQPGEWLDEVYIHKLAPAATRVP